MAGDVQWKYLTHKELRTADSVLQSDVVSTFLQDFRYALRTLSKARTFTLAALLILGLGIGATTAIFSVVNSVVLRPIPYPHADRLAIIWETDLRHGVKREGPSAPNFLDWKQQSRSFDDMTLFEVGTGVLTGEGEPEQLPGLRVTANFLSMLGARTVLGRGFTEADTIGDKRQPLAVITNGFWKRRFSSDAAVIGKTITLNSEPYTVIGVLGPEFWQPVPVDVIVPWPNGELRARSRTNHDFGVIARRKPNVTFAQAQAELSAIARRINNNTPGLAGWDVTVVPLQQALTESIRPALLLLLGAVGFLLLLACVNVASLLLARVTGRSKEIAIRAALGARRGRLIRQILNESLLLALGGGVLGILLATWGVTLLGSILPATLPLPDAGAEIVRPELTIDSRVLIFAVVISICTALIFGIIPAFRASIAGVNDSLKYGGRTSSSSPARRRVWMYLVTGEIGLACALLTGAGLAMKSFVNLQRVNPGFIPGRVLTFQMRLPTDNRYRDSREQADFYRRVLENAARIPGAESAGLTDILPLGQQNDREYFTIENRPLPQGQRLVADFRRVSASYFRTMRIPLIAGRFLSDRDVRNAPPVLVVDETLAHQYWPKENPLGRHLNIWGQPREIVGVVAAVRHYGLDKQAEPTIYAPYLQMPKDRMALAIRSASDTRGMVNAAKRAVWAVDRDQPIFQIREMNDYLALADTGPRLSMFLLTVFAAVSVFLAALGIYGVVSYGVTERTREFGLRVALGAAPEQMRALVLRQGLRTAAVGLTAGLAGAAALTPIVSALFYGVTPLDPIVIAAVAAILLTVALIANYVPARRATRIDAMEALRHE